MKTSLVVSITPDCKSGEGTGLRMTVQVNFSTPDSRVCWSTKYGCELIKTGVILLTSESFVKLKVKQVGLDLR